MLLLTAVTAAKARGAHHPRDLRGKSRSAPEDALLPLAAKATQIRRDDRQRDREKDRRIVQDDALLLADINARKEGDMDLTEIPPALHYILANLAEHLQNPRILAVRMYRVKVAVAQVATWK